MTTSLSKYVALPINGEMVQTDENTVLEFTTTDDNVYTIEVASFPGPPSYDGRAPGFERGGQVHHVITAMRVWINGTESTKVVALAYTDVKRQLVPLFSAVDVIKGKHGDKERPSVVLYRAVDPRTGAVAKSLNVTDVVVRSSAAVKKTA